MKKQATLGRYFSSLKRPQEDEHGDDIAKKSKLETYKGTKELLSNDLGLTNSSQPKLSVGEAENTGAEKLPVNPVAAALQPDKHGTDVPYASLCSVYEEIEGISSRLSIIKLCSDYLYRILEQRRENLIPVTYLFINRLGPDYEPGLELGLGEGILIKTIGEAYGKSLAQVRNSYRECGDLGTVAQQARMVQPTMFKPKPLLVNEVFQNLQNIAKAEGKDSQNKKIRLIKKMLTACQGVEAKFLIRSLESKLRIGLAEKTVLISLSKAMLRHERKGKEPSPEEVESAEQKIRDAFCQVPNYEIVINSALDHGIMNLDQHCVLKPGIPLKPMLAKPTKSVTEVLDRFQNQRFTCEYKYDGERAQVHLLPDGSMRIYSRNGENMTERYPELKIRNFLKTPESTNSMILDCEAVAWDKEQNKILPFQVLSTRKRKGVELKDVKVRVCLFVFDILCLNGEPLINFSLAERRERLTETLQPVPGELQYANEITTASLEELQNYLDQSVKDSCEGLMVKMLDGEESHYEPSKRSRNWLKLKKDYLAGVGDSLDLVVLGAYHGRGKRTGTYGVFLLGCYNPDSEDFETCCKIGTGFSEDDLQSLHDKLKDTIIEFPRGNILYDESSPPDVWFQPSLIFEVLTADLSLSPVYKAGCHVYDKGISLRFPRYLKLREDKTPTEATTSEQVVALYENQSQLQSKAS
ncbi:HGL297Wp [Eremothecium sinecaudum]|uniref:DNA ligase n=1 Tax=Eremothecium sinecaudum TaxID=45286 RepID=A0A0X8HV96_9SACH|nr:HGL297Wp [Eremothecium sinecaudum]AMD22043.1 HGL297Wp [Eremothecium sinecaudum]